MIKDFALPVPGHLAYSIVSFKEQFFEVSTINLPLTRIVNFSCQWRDEWWQPPFPNETMVWECKKDGRRFGDILHCQGYRKPESAKRAHHRLCRKIEVDGKHALNGREYQTTSQDKDKRPMGLLNSIERRLRCIDIF